VVAGTPDAVAAVKDQAREAGGRALPLDVEGAFHSPAMAPAVDAVRDAIAALELAEPRVPLVSGSTASPLHDAGAIGDALVAGILSPVRWREVQLQLEAMGVTDLVEVGPGGVLAGLAKRTVPELTVHTIAGPDDLESAVAALRGMSAVQ
jgi:[acyl-carrier-protein] S-malonyltransferase